MIRAKYFHVLRSRKYRKKKKESKNATNDQNYSVQENASTTKYACEKDENRLLSAENGVNNCLQNLENEDVRTLINSKDQKVEEEEYNTDCYSPDDEELSNSEDGEDDEYIENEFKDEIPALRKWAVEHKIRGTHLDQLLLILRQRLLPELPKTSKTFLKTEPSSYEIQEILLDDEVIAEYIYFSILDGLRRCTNVDLHESNVIEVQFNIDGLPLFKSSTVNFWPILCKVFFEPDIYKPFPVAIYGGKGKCTDLNILLNDFVQEVSNLQKYDFEIDGKLFTLKIHSIICDTPARSFVRCTPGHVGFHACERCCVIGYKYNHVTVFDSGKENKQRTDHTFRKQKHSKHHKGTSPLVDIEPKIDMVFDFVLDFMHLCCLGIMKKLLRYWLVSSLDTKLGYRSRKSLSRRMDLLRRQAPSEFPRKPRSTDYLTFWKATEYRFFLLYCGPFVLKGLLPKIIYRHFILFHTACRLLCSDNHALNYTEAAKTFLDKFVLMSKQIYGKTSLVLNMHNLKHLADDVTNKKCSLSRMTAFPFESLLGEMKRSIRTGNKPVAQFRNRFDEFNSHINQKAIVPKEVQILKRTKKDSKDLIKIKYKNFTLSVKSPDNVVLLFNESCFKIEKITLEGPVTANTIKISGRVWNVAKPLFKYPFDSSKLQMWILRSRVSTKSKKLRLSCVENKMVLMELEIGNSTEYAAVPYLH